ncbi:hypothetical protein JTB14_028679 [Gonioctena quinquepunctata]|nr:hypothetical protein JTB14_028679 [Gonioctena quinquepunctata]
MPQSKAINCYLLMSIWILLIIIGVYKFLEPKEQALDTALNPTQLLSQLTVDAKTKRIFKICNFPEEMTSGDEGKLKDKKWLFKGLLILLRHGDRGPLQHLKRISGINCGIENNELLTAYKCDIIGFMANVTDVFVHVGSTMP